MSRTLGQVVVLAAVSLGVAACSSAGSDADPSDGPARTSAQTVTTLTQDEGSTTTTAPPPTTTTTTIPTFTLEGQVLTSDALPLADALVTVGSVSVETKDDGSFRIEQAPAGLVSITRPAWQAAEVEWNGTGSLSVILEPFVVRALRAHKSVLRDADSYEALLDMAAASSINALIFDTKDESGSVLYATGVEKALAIDAVDAFYDPQTAVAAAHDRDLYAITRIVTFEDSVWSGADPEAKLAGIWIDPLRTANWEYPLALATEACELGFDEIQFDYVRFPSGEAASVAQRIRPTTAAQRVGTIRAFLAEAQNRLHDVGCAVSADVFAIVLTLVDEQGVGQRPEELSTVVDAISPMVYPGHYEDGWMGFADPNSHPGPVVARALDDGVSRISRVAIMRPWLQAFGYTPEQVLVGIDEAEARSVGWMLWNATGDYEEAWLPAG